MYYYYYYLLLVCFGAQRINPHSAFFSIVAVKAGIEYVCTAYGVLCTEYRRLDSTASSVSTAVYRLTR